MKLIVDENLPPAWIEKLASARIDAVLWSSLGPADAPDTEIIEYALRNAHVILTRDLDFGIHLTRTRATGQSVIQMRTPDTNPAVVGEQVIEAIEVHLTDLAAGAILTVDAWTKRRVRVTLLPVHS